MKEVINSQPDKKGFLRKATATAGMLIALTACEQAKITEGTVYQKEHIKKEWALVGKLLVSHQKIEREAVSTPPIHDEKGLYDRETISRSIRHGYEDWKAYIAQCPKGELPPLDKIEKECKTNSFDVPQEVYPALKIGQHTDFKKLK